MKPGYIIIIAVILILAVGAACFFWGRSIAKPAEIQIDTTVHKLDAGLIHRADSLKILVAIRTHERDSLKILLNTKHVIHEKNIASVDTLPVTDLTRELAKYYGWPMPGQRKN